LLIILNDICYLEYLGLSLHSVSFVYHI